MEREECADRNVCTFGFDSQDLGSPDTNKQHSSLNVWTESLSHFIELNCSGEHVSNTAALNPWLEGHLRPRGGLQVCSRLQTEKALCPSGCSLATRRRQKGNNPPQQKQVRVETQPSTQTAGLKTFLLFIGPHMIWHIILNRF